MSIATDAVVAAPVVSGARSDSGPPAGPLVGIAIVLGITVLAAIWGAFRRRRATDHDPALDGVPLVIEGLSKKYPGDVVAVDDLSFRVEAGQVLGLLGPNGAGKTTSLRMLMGLIQPTGGNIRVFGHKVYSGAPVLSRIGSFVEGAGFLPHLSGQANLELYWAATGRPPSKAHIEEALEIAGLGKAVHRRVRTYSQGMRQRLAIAQAMLGLPDLLVLDEPTNGLDPPQIHQMRAVLRRYASTGRTVVVSSHLLAEVEQTCDHVVVMHHGKLVASGPVEDIVGGGGEATFRVDQPEKAATVLRSVNGVEACRDRRQPGACRPGRTPPRRGAGEARRCRRRGGTGRPPASVGRRFPCSGGRINERRRSDVHTDRRPSAGWPRPPSTRTRASRPTAP